ncbi:MAG TPA: hypothetical protein VK804_24910 [Bradyrhizobium sp.]|jgi:hypothetical protein|nr:hypothetical protein [Bradyrhizobium sp.]HTB03724.1 hypothetical protein [Bradyrhizobium sp.]
MFAEMPLDNLDGNQIRGLGRHLGLPPLETSPPAKRPNVSSWSIVL